MKLVKLMDLFRVGSSKRVLKADWKESGVPFYRGREITRLSKTGSADNELFISESHFKDLSTKYGVPIAGDIMVTAIGTIGNTHIVNESDRFYFKDASVLWLHKQAEVNSRFIDYWLKSDFFFEQLDKGNGATVDTLTIEKLSNVELLLPSLEKQREIVEKLDTSFVEIDLLEQNLGLCDEKANQLLLSILSSTFKQSTGVSEQNEFSVEENLAIKPIKLVDLCKLVGGGTPSKANTEYYSGNIPWATVRDMRSRWLEDTEHKINEIAVRESSTNVIPSGNVVLASRVGLGKVIQLKHDTAINQDLRALIPKENSKIDSDYLYYWTLSITPEIISAGKGATVQGVTLPFLENLVVPLPSLEKQGEVVEKLDSAFAEIDLLKMQIRKEKDYAFGLRQSLLSSAFTQVEEVA